ncbi:MULTISPECIES: DUF2332 family protein [unclassified Novosphingobium]|uniref:DUF2332 domain-containing protein n=1 Tax=unclassified Novosphingobium TaxID=2644732 RepID=UPI0017B45A6A|nr:MULTISPECIES: DUF2332 family protein [unclassified Novosphingobium]NMN05103.1 hypothetical protein [Novosphingobium sp. SG919]NMN87398.1 hypothetical protein [Novosphingobium sp. SG916]
MMAVSLPARDEVASAAGQGKRFGRDAGLGAGPRVGVVAEPRRDGLRTHAARIAALGSPFVARLLEAAWRQLDQAPELALMFDNWPGEFGADAVAFRLASALHALALAGDPPRLAALFASQNGDFEAAVGEALALHQGFVIGWMAHPTQTNEVARSAAFAAALLTLDRQGPLPVELLEVGASAGLNLNLGHYRHILGRTTCGPANSPLSIVPDWRGASPPPAALRIASARGVDLAPIDPREPASATRMQAYVWPDKPDRLARLQAAIAIARRHPPLVDRESAAPWLERRLAAPQAQGTRRVIVHSMVMQYLSAGERGEITATIIRAGAAATPERPLAWIGLEWAADRSAVMLQATHWGAGVRSGGQTQTLARVHPYGEWIEWLA